MVSDMMSWWHYLRGRCSVKLQQICMRNWYYSNNLPTESCSVAAAATYMPAGLVLLSPTPLLFKHAYWLSAAARWMLAGLWSLNQHAC